MNYQKAVFEIAISWTSLKLSVRRLNKGRKVVMDPKKLLFGLTSADLAHLAYQLAVKIVRLQILILMRT